VPAWRRNRSSDHDPELPLVSSRHRSPDGHALCVTKGVTQNPVRSDPFSPESPIVVVEDLVKTYDDRVVIDHVSFHVDRGETLVIVGGSGAGKSTLLRQIVGLERPDSGRIFIAGVDQLALNEVALLREHRRFAVVFQKDALLDSLSVFDNVAFPLREELGLRGREVERRVMAKLSALGLAEARDKLVGELSGGMAKRLGVARALVVEPEILFYDEPTTGLDPVSSRKVDDLIEEMRATFFITSIVITHDMASAFEIADRVMLLEHGRFVEEGAPETFFASANAAVRTFTDSSAVDPQKLLARRARRKKPSEISAGWLAASSSRAARGEGRGILSAVEL
jgi:phospholipid/cholesterol/gamma-HCH transport system ATP-binding protein